MKTKWIVVAAVTAATLTSGCMAFREISGQGGGSSSRDSSDSMASDDEAFVEPDDRTSIDEAVSRSADATDRSADATSRAAAAADRAAAVAARASMEAERTETGFQRGLRK